MNLISRSFLMGMIVGAGIFMVDMGYQSKSSEKINIQPSVYRLKVGDRHFCSAFKVGNKKLITARHCCEATTNTGNLFVENHIDGSSIVDVNIYDGATDACIITSLVNLSTPDLPVSYEPVGRGDKLISIGYPAAGPKIKLVPVEVITPNYRSAAIYFFNVVMPSEWLIESRGLIFRGQSGGPVINSIGEVVGINARVNDSEKKSYFAPTVKIKKWIQEGIN